MRYSLLFILVLTGCVKQKSDVIINWEGGKAVSISVADSVRVYLKGSTYPVIGDFSNGVFTPAVPFQPGNEYVVLSKYDSSSFSIPALEGDTPELLATYPSCDTVPSNLLKIYLQFSEPMQEYRSSGFVQLFDAATGDTIRDAFLDLKPELWNEDGTVLTLWIDPGRIKQDLVPNKELGVVLEQRHSYRLEVAKGWKSKKGVTTSNNYSRRFVTSTRDVTKPNVDDLSVVVRNDTIVVNLKETLDWMLLNQSVSIWSDNHIKRSKTFSEVCERQLLIVPDPVLGRGKYELRFDALLEDLAGNNFNRLFETDVTKGSNNSVNKESYSLPFQVN